MKTMIIAAGLALSLSAFSNGPRYAPNDGSAEPGNPGTGKAFSKEKVKSGPATTSTDTTLQRGAADPDTEVNENLERSNTSPNPIPSDTTLQRTPGTKQSQEATEDKLDFRTKPEVDHNDTIPTDNQ